ncbi:MAG TPA: hypothetical protein VG735_03415 [Caulobacterales bacterium]|jgi:hypothetical protein|nr:hypothetical protein [Caulobacterales bacterium]
MAKLRILLLSHVRPGHAGTSHDHEWALAELSAHDVFVHSPVEERDWCPPLSEFDVIILHYSLMIWSESYLPPFYHDRIAAFRGLKAMFIQDEYREVFNAIDMMERLGIDLLFTCVPPRNIEATYGELLRRGVRIEPTLTGYVPISFDENVVTPMAERPLDVVYRTREVPFALGKLAQEKFQIAQTFSAHAKRTSLRCDISSREEDRIYADDWYHFIASARASLGTESGASIMDFTGDIDRAVKASLADQPKASFDEIHQRLLAPYEGNVVINTISPRAFEAIYLRNVLVAFPGEYSGVLEPGRHYIVLEKDFSNFKDVAKQIADAAHMQAIADRAYEDIIQSGAWSYATFAADIDSLIEQEWERRVRRPAITAPKGVHVRKPVRSAPASREAWRGYLSTFGPVRPPRPLTNYNAQRLANGAAAASPVAVALALETVREPEPEPPPPATAEHAPDSALAATSERAPEYALESGSAPLPAQPEFVLDPNLPSEEVAPRNPLARILLWLGGATASVVFRRRLRVRFELFHES